MTADLAVPTMSDAAVIDASRVRPAEFAALFDRHAGVIREYLARRVGPHPAEDLTGETFLVAFSKRDKYDISRPNALPWLYGIASNPVRQRRRTEVRRLRALERTGIDPAFADHAESVSARVSAQAGTRRLAGALAKLTAGERDVLLLAAWADHAATDRAPDRVRHDPGAQAVRQLADEERVATGQLVHPAHGVRVGGLAGQLRELPPHRVPGEPGQSHPAGAGSRCTSSRTTTSPRPRAIPTSSSASRVYPMPGSPPHSTTLGTPADTASRQPAGTPTSDSRPTNPAPTITARCSHGSSGVTAIGSFHRVPGREPDNVPPATMLGDAQPCSHSLCLNSHRSPVRPGRPP